MGASRDELGGFFEAVLPHLNGVQRRVVAGVMSTMMGRGAKTAVAESSGLGRNTVAKGEREVARGSSRRIGISPDHAALAVLLGVNGLRVSEAYATNTEDLGTDRDHRTLRIIGKGNKPAVIPLVPRTARTLDLLIGERTKGPLLRRQDRTRLDRRTAHRWIQSIGKKTGLGHVHPHMVRAAFITAAPEAGVPLREVQTADPRTTTIYDHRRQSFDRHTTYVVVAYVTGS
ncbi:MAG: tyrosine-type recombinase/integrase [Actinomycetia bacterium]|nr:tyrosine-type recombinase/integrase [Actinomycetes bacterium]